MSDEMTLEEVRAWRAHEWPRRGGMRTTKGRIRAAGDTQDSSEVSTSTLSDEDFMALCNAISHWFAFPDNDTTNLVEAEALISLLPWLGALSKWNHGLDKQPLTELLAERDPPAAIADLVNSRRPEGKRGPWLKDVHPTEAELKAMRIEYDHYIQLPGLKQVDAVEVVSCRWGHSPSLLLNLVKAKRGNSRRLRAKNKL